MTSTTVTSRPGSASNATTAPSSPTPPAGQPTPAPQHDVLTEATTAVMLPFAMVRSLIPDSAVPVALGIGALAVAGAIDWPAAAAVALGYLAVRGWRPSTPRSA
jgi:hypothetical protein